MFCPNCGNAEQVVNSYCRNCGEWLPDLKKSTSLAFGGSSPEENIKHSLWLSAMSAIICVVLAIALYATYLGTDQGTSLIYLTAAFLLALAGWQVSNVYIVSKLRRHLARRRFANFKRNQISALPTFDNALPAADTAELVRPPASVTEHSTDLLEPILRKQNK